MSDNSRIEWTQATWNPVTGCTKVSPGCDHCYAETFAERWRGTAGHHFEHGFDVTLRPERLEQPLRWKQPRRIFVNSMSDLFHEAVPDDYIIRVFDVMQNARQHTFQVLTKRHGRMRSFVHRYLSGEFATQPLDEAPLYATVDAPPPNIWLGVSAEDQKCADIRGPVLLDTPAAVRFVSAEPLLGPVDLTFLAGIDGLRPDWCGGMGAPHPLLDWVIAGGESGPGARPCDLAWLQALVAQCDQDKVPIFVKQLGSVLGRQLGAGSKGGSWDAWPEDLRVRQFPALEQREHSATA
jgi:protein gp37